MADEIKQASSAAIEAPKVVELEHHKESHQVPKTPKLEDLPALPQSPTVEKTLSPSSSPRIEINNDKHFSTAPTLNSPLLHVRETDAESKSSNGEKQGITQRHSYMAHEQSCEIAPAPYSPKHAPNDYRNTGTWQDASYPKKQEYDVEAREVDEDDGIDWKPGMRNQFPWIGFAGFVTIIIATALAVAILGLSDGKRVDDWPFKKYPVQPNVLLNIANQVQNLGLITLIAQGLAIAWWRKALRGSSLKTLHRNHAYSYSFYAIVTSGRHFNIIALAALMTKFAVIDSTLFQKATKTQITQQKAYMNTTVTAWIESDWPTHSGGVPGDEGNIKTVDTAWANVIDAYNSKIANGKVHDTLKEMAAFFDCPSRQECSGYIEAMGFAFECETESKDVDYGLDHANVTVNGTRSEYPLWNIKFEPDFSNGTKPYSAINMTMLYVDSEAGTAEGSCPGTLTNRTCRIRPAIVKYPIVVMTPSKEELDGGNIVVHIKFFNDNASWPLGAPLNSEQIDDLEVVRYVDIDESFAQVSTIGAVNYVLNNLYSSNANLTFTTGWDLQSRGSQAQSVFYATNDQDDAEKCWYDIKKAGRDDPLVELLRKVNTLAFVAGLYVKSAPTIARKDRTSAHQTFQASVTGIVEQYKTTFGYVGGALAATFITVIFVLPVYWGYWELGRKVTLGPLEISHAFRASIIAPEKTKNHHGDFNEVLDEVGKRRIQYGQIVGAPLGQMGIAEPHKVATPDARQGGKVMHNKSNRRLAMGAAIGGVLAAAIGGNAK
ncbi:hypothetical protein EK21DRAFT_89769 [Setomelanomma holmii]|uniref:Uncharacterized protein n=1 Tax=Setomelanomma holmii TaxID=210430 RepID=A0A9P4H7G1_9PLEO|nr:hypothetical protein EK21DRAFT_89769 [Setomelanomma holmii]